MAKFLIKSRDNVTVYSLVEATNEEEALDKWENGDINDTWNADSQGEVFLEISEVHD